ncbi:hypothetical protein MRX96_017876 [Rhipicephalus microplus]
MRPPEKRPPDQTAPPSQQPYKKALLTNASAKVAQAPTETQRISAQKTSTQAPREREYQFAAETRAGIAVNRIIQAFRDDGGFTDMERSGRPRTMTEEEDRLITTAAIMPDPFQSAENIREALSLTVSSETVRRMLIPMELLGCRKTIHEFAALIFKATAKVTFVNIQPTSPQSFHLCTDKRHVTSKRHKGWRDAFSRISATNLCKHSQPVPHTTALQRNTRYAKQKNV